MGFTHTFHHPGRTMMLLGLVMVLQALGTTESSARPVKLSGIQTVDGFDFRISPDGDRLAFTRQGAICVMTLSNGRLTLLTGGPAQDVEPAWSPDGRRIAFMRGSDFRTGIVHLIDARSGKETDLPSRVRARGELFFHPDGKRVLGRYQSGDGAICLGWLDLDSGVVASIAGAPTEPFVISAYNFPLALSPDGRHIYWAQHADRPDEQGGNNGPFADIYRLPSEGGQAEHVATWPARIFRMIVGADGNSLFVVTDLGSVHNNIWQVPLNASIGESKQLTFGLGDEDWPAPSRDGNQLYYGDNLAGSITLICRSDADSRVIAPSSVSFGATTGRVRVSVVDGATGAPVFARIAVRRLDGAGAGSFHAPPGAIYRLYKGLVHFYDQSASLQVPVGDYEILVNRGLEYAEARQRVEVRRARTAPVEIPMRRWANMAEEGWWSGENHIHANYGYGEWYNNEETMRAQCFGEDLNVANLMVANSDGNAVIDREYFRGRKSWLSSDRYILYWNEEFRSTMWGHMTLTNLTQLVEPIFTGFLHTTHPHDVPTNATIADWAHLGQQGLVSYTHPARNMDDPYDSAYSAKGLPADAALGKIDMIDVMGGGYHESLTVWYRLMNCGLRLPAAAGTDSFLNRVNSQVPGWGRTYVKLDGPLDYEAWSAGQKAGRSFVTNGPMMEFTVDGNPSGNSIQMSGLGTVHVHARAWWSDDLVRLEIVHNGEVLESVAPSTAGPGTDLAFDGELELRHPGWIAARTLGPTRTAAHANPVWIDMPGQVPHASDDAAYFVKWIERLEADLERRARIPIGRDKVFEDLDTAKSFYRRIETRD